MQKEWLRDYQIVSPEQIKKMPCGTKILIHGADRHGEHTILETIITQFGKHKMLRSYDYGGERVMRPIKALAGKEYTLERKK